jgi:hypothetical protein
MSSQSLPFSCLLLEVPGLSQYHPGMVFPLRSRLGTLLQALPSSCFQLVFQAQLQEFLLASCLWASNYPELVGYELSSPLQTQLQCMECNAGDSRSLPKDRICHRECSFHMLPSLSMRSVGVPSRTAARLASLPWHCGGGVNRRHPRFDDIQKKSHQSSQSAGRFRTRMNQLCPDLLAFIFSWDSCTWPP